MNPTKHLFEHAGSQGRLVTVTHTIKSGETRVREGAMVAAVHDSHVVLCTPTGYRTVKFEGIKHALLHN